MQPHFPPRAFDGTPEQLRERVAELTRRLKDLGDRHATGVRKRREAESALRYAKDILEAVGQPIVVLNDRLIVLSANRAYYDTFRTGPSDTVGKSVYDLGSRAWDSPRLRSLLDALVADDLPVEGLEVERDFAAIGRRVMLLGARKVRHLEAATQTILVAFEDVTDRKRAEDLLIAAAITDPMTGLNNRRGLFLQAEKVLAHAHREGRHVHVLYLDLDRLKAINDDFGHEAGDAALADTAAVLRETFRDADILARMGGDEFVVMWTEARPNGVAQVERLRRALRGNRARRHRAFNLSLSEGHVRVPPGTRRNLADLLAEADAEMYRQKRKRRA